MNTRPITVRAQSGRGAKARAASATMSADRTFTAGMIMCAIWFSAATMLICQAQRSDLVAYRFTSKQVFLIPGR
jgi:hypothetical protein